MSRSLDGDDVRWFFRRSSPGGGGRWPGRDRPVCSDVQPCELRRRDDGPVILVAGLVCLRIGRMGRGHGTPSDVVRPRVPVDARGGPFVAGDPHPAQRTYLGPVAVVVHNPAVRLVRVPHPSPVGPHPLAVCIRPPVRHHGGLPDATVRADVNPVAVRVQDGVRLVRRSVGSRRFRRACRIIVSSRTAGGHQSNKRNNENLIFHGVPFEKEKSRILSPF
jgi:hypothetical protein